MLELLKSSYGFEPFCRNSIGFLQPHSYDPKGFYMRISLRIKILRIHLKILQSKGSLCWKSKNDAQYSIQQTSCRMCFQWADPPPNIKIDQRDCNTVVLIFGTFCFCLVQVSLYQYQLSCLLIMFLSSFSYSAPVIVDIEYTVGKTHTVYRKVTSKVCLKHHLLPPP